MRILLASSEVHPYSKTGGLADMVGALAKTLARDGHRAGVVTPLYVGLRERFPGLKRLDWALELPLGARSVRAAVWGLEPIPGLTVYFVDQPAFFQRAGSMERTAQIIPTTPSGLSSSRRRSLTWRCNWTGSPRCCTCTIGRLPRPPCCCNTIESRQGRGARRGFA